VRALRRDMNGLFDELFGEASLVPLGEEWSVFSPRVDVAEDDMQVRVSAELPGLDEKNIEVNLSGDVLTISGEKKQEREEKAENRYRMERSFGAFRRSIPLPCEIDAGKAEATFDKGVLIITLPKMESAQDRKRIVVRSGEGRS
jgi:HSP20 family protein